MIYNNVMCKYSMYKIKQPDGNYSKVSYSYNKLCNMYDLNTIKRFLIKKQIIIIPCGKCQDCIDTKRCIYKNKVSSQMKLSKYSYLITFTFNNNKIFTLLDNTDKNYLLSLSNTSAISPYTNLSKLDIEKIIINIKNKFNRYYKTKVKVHYFLCGEYGSNTHRSHYHCLLFSDYPIPDLQKIQADGLHFTSKFIDSKQFDMYDIQLCDSNSKNTSNYITKYLSKSKTSEFTNFNRFEEQQIRWLLKNNFDLWNCFLFPNKETMTRDLIFYWLMLNDYYAFKFLLDNFFIFRNKRIYKDVNKQCEFIKTSRKLGISDDLFYNYQNNVLNYYYIKKYEFYYNFYLNLLYSLCLCDDLIIFVLDLVYIFRYIMFLLLSFNKLFADLENKRRNSIITNFGRPNKKKDFQMYKNYASNDIF